MPQPANQTGTVPESSAVDVNPFEKRATNRVTQSGKIPYKAYEGSAHRQLGIQLIGNDGIPQIMYYAYLMTVLPASHQSFSLIFTNHVYTVKGRNLLEIVPQFQEHSIKQLQCFHLKRHQEPASDAPIITDIVLESYQEVIEGMATENIYQIILDVLASRVEGIKSQLIVPAVNEVIEKMRNGRK